MVSTPLAFNLRKGARWPYLSLSVRKVTNAHRPATTHRENWKILPVPDERTPVSNRRKTKMTAAELAQLAADWHRAAELEALARSAAERQQQACWDDAPLRGEQADDGDD